MYKTEKVATVAERLKEAMGITGKKQTDLVQATGVNKSTVSRYLRGEREPKQKALYNLARCLNVSEAWLLGFDVPMERTAQQKKNDLLAELVVKMRRDVDFCNTVAELASLGPAEYASIKQLLSALGKK